jgi:hypothetical protein
MGVRKGLFAGAANKNTAVFMPKPEPMSCSRFRVLFYRVLPANLQAVAV